MEMRLADKCPECGSPNLIQDYESGEKICSDCGLVLADSVIDRGPEWRAFSAEERASRPRTGTPTTYSVHDKGLSTDIGGPFGLNYDAFGKKLPLATRLQMSRLRKWHIRSRFHDSTDRNLLQAMSELERLSDKLTIPKQIREIAAIIYRKALVKGIIRGRSITAIAAAALYVACRMIGIPRTLEEISEGNPVYEKEVARNYRLLIRKLDLQMPIVSPIACISKIADPLMISGETQGLAIKILREAKRKRISSGKDPMGLAASALYIANRQQNERRTQKEIAEIAKVTEVTIRNGCRELERRLNLEIPPLK